MNSAPNSDFLNLHNRNSTWNQNLQLRSTDSPHLHLEYKSPHRISRRLQWSYLDDVEEIIAGMKVLSRYYLSHNICWINCF
ncbi:hypothetical protein AtNW77_Chr3g0188651 [Arabidopsis thaliana]